MKKIILIVAALLLVVLSLSSCKSKDCPAYTNNQADTEMPSLA